MEDKPLLHQGLMSLWIWMNADEDVFGAPGRSEKTQQNQIVNKQRVSKNRYDFPENSKIYDSPVFHPFFDLLMPPDPGAEIRNAAPDGARSGVKAKRVSETQSAKDKQVRGENQDPNFEELIDQHDDSVENRRVALIRNGYRPIPVEGKRPSLSGWQNLHATELDSRRWSRTEPKARNTGIVLGQSLIAVDIDVWNQKVSADLAQKARRLGDRPPLERIGRAPKTLLLYRTDTPIRKQATAAYVDGASKHKVEILGEGQQFVADGDHPDTGKPYVWTTQSPLDVQINALPLIDHSKLADFLIEADSVLAATGWQRKDSQTDVPNHPQLPGLEHKPLPVDECRKILNDLATLDPAWRDQNYYWHRVGCALHDNFHGSTEGLDLWIEFSRPGPNFDRAELLTNWRSMRPRSGAVTMGTIIDAVAKLRASRRNARIDSTFEKEGQSHPSRLSFLTPDQCADAPKREYVWKGILARGDVGCVFGQPGTGKSLIAPLIGYAISQGRTAFGNRTKQGGVFYVAAEDPHGMRGRIAALKSAQGQSDDFALVEGVSDLFVQDSPDLAALLAAVKERPPALIVIDTLSMAFPGLEENSGESMMRVVAVARDLTQYGAAVLMVHHDTKAEGATPRGHSVLNGALDMAMHVQRDENGIVRGKLTKNRNGSCDQDIAFRIDVHTMGNDADGDPITYARAAELNAAEVVRMPRLTPAEARARTVLRDLVGPGDGIMQRVVSEERWRQACFDGGVAANDNPESRRKAVYRVMNGLIRKGVVLSSNGNMRLAHGSAPGMTETSFEDAFDDVA